MLADINSTVTGNCSHDGGTLGLWVASGNGGIETITVKGADNKTYVNQSSTYSCLTFYKNFTGPAQVYEVTLGSGAGGSTCGYAIAKLNSTTTPPAKIYNDVYNGKFENGEYTGWATSSKGFGTGPLNITYANSKNCYLYQEWSNYNGTFFATTYNCGLAVAPGTLTSSEFYVNATRPFLNFRIISSYNSGLYIEILRSNTPVITAHYNTYNLSLDANAVSTFRNASIPLSLYANKAVQIRITSKVVGEQPFIAVGDFALSNRPVQQLGILTNMTLTN
jgi:hypothetical protein